MREIKFRAWDKKYNRWITYVAASTELGVIFSDGDWSDNIDNYVVVQYTGLKDKNGKEIFEGDIIEWCKIYTTYRSMGSVSFTDGEYSVDRVSLKYLALMCNGGCEVIGNIYENPELLEVKQ